MYGMNRITGKRLAGVDHIRQSIMDILTTPRLSRVMRRLYGSTIKELIDSPMNDSGVSQLIAAIADAIFRWEKRIRVKKIEIEKMQSGKIDITLYCVYSDSQQELVLDGLTVNT
jgi:phage baseplate assembly protein W